MKYQIEIYQFGKWSKVPFAESNLKSYCEGYLHAVDSRYPSEPHRIVLGDKVLKEIKGHSQPSITNKDS